MKAEARVHLLHTGEEQELVLAHWIYCISLLRFLPFVFKSFLLFVFFCSFYVTVSHPLVLFQCCYTIACFSSHTHHFSWATIKWRCTSLKCTSSITGSGLYLPHFCRNSLARGRNRESVYCKASKSCVSMSVFHMKWEGHISKQHPFPKHTWITVFLTVQVLHFSAQHIGLILSRFLRHTALYTELRNKS